MLSTWIRSLLLNLLKKDKSMVKEPDGFVCHQCKAIALYKDYYRINSNDFCSLQCYEDYRLRPVVAPKVKRVAKKKKVLKRKKK
jgi:hypothetical protein